MILQNQALQCTHGSGNILFPIRIFLIGQKFVLLTSEPKSLGGGAYWD